MKERKNCCNNCSINDIIESIALEEAGIAHILNAEGEKIQKALAGEISFEQIILLNKTVACVINDVTNLEISLSNKIKALSCTQLQKPCACCVIFLVCSQNTGKPLAGADIKIYLNNNVVKCGTTDCNGILYICNLEKARYFATVKFEKAERRECLDLSCCTGTESYKICLQAEEPC